MHSYWGEIACGTISAEMSGPHEGWFREASQRGCSKDPQLKASAAISFQQGELLSSCLERRLSQVLLDAFIQLVINPEIRFPGIGPTLIIK